jgi:ABC-type uncharacterized transport system permease subunit
MQKFEDIKMKRTLSGKSIVVIILALLEVIIFFWQANVTTGFFSTMVLTSQRAGVTIAAPDLVLPTSATFIFFGIITALLGIWYVAKGFKGGNTIVIILSALAIFAFIVWAAKDKSINLTGMLVSSIVRATPIALAALSGIYSERSGLVNIGIEGMMLAGAFTSIVFASATGSLFWGVISGIVVGILLGLLHGVLCIKYMVNQIISGTGIIILALGVTTYLNRTLLEYRKELGVPGPSIAAFPIPGLWRIPVLGPVFFNQSPLIYILWIALIVTYIYLYYTKWGLRTRSVGEHPQAADTLGINVFRTRYISVLVSGAFGGLAGAYMAVGSAGRFEEGMSAGKGFLGLAAMIFGNWNPGGAYIGALIFGFFDSWQEKLSILQVGVSADLLGMAPYIATMIVLAGFIGRSRMPAADGTPYKKQ